MILRKYPVVIVCVVLLAVISTVVWYSAGSYVKFVEYHERLAGRSVQGTSRELALFIDEQNRYARLFAEREQALLGALVESPDDVRLHKKLEDNIKIYFQNLFAFTIASSQGNTLHGRVNDLIGRTCRNDIREFMAGEKRYHIYVHEGPKTERQHYDVMTAISYQGETLVFFVSFFLDDIFRRLEHGNVEGHQLFLIKHGKQSMLEASTAGAVELFEQSGHEFVEIPSVKPNETRKLWPDSMGLNAMSSLSVDGTKWELIDVPEPGLLQQYRLWLAFEAIGIVTFSLLVAAFGYWLTKKYSTLSFNTYSVLTGIEKERQRVAMDLHDQVLSDISHIRRDCRSLCATEKTPQSIETHSRSIQSQLDQVSNTIRDVIEDLHPQSISILGLAETIRSYCGKQSRLTSRLAIKLSVGEWDERRLNNAKRLNLFRIFQEVVNNTIRHAQAGQIEVDLKMTANRLILVVEDDGVGVGTKKGRAPSGRGIMNIAARGRMIHANTSWSPGSRGTGTRFTLKMPFASKST